MPVQEEILLKEGAKAPDFSLPSSEGKTVSLKDFKGKSNLILYFYPKDLTPGCTQEACDFRDLYKEFKKAGAEIYGVSCDPLKLHDKFIQTHKLPFPLLSDEDKSMVQKYGVYKEKSMYGKKYMGIERTTLVIDKDLKIRKIFPKVKVTDHVKEVLETVKSL
jgi:thioredoxin-dependent peroxiredoxin